MHETHILEHKNVGLYTCRGGGLKMYTVCTLIKILTFLDSPLDLLLTDEYSSQRYSLLTTNSETPCLY